MKKLTIHVILIISMAFSFTVFSQELPDIVPTSPNAYEMTKYGNIQINESSGMVNHSIPIHAYKLKNFELPININYLGAGVKVNALSSWLGVNWTLKAGGVITRSVNHLLDEAAPNRLLYDREDFDTMNLDTNNSNDLAFLNGLALGTLTNAYDKKVDIFNFSFNGYSGSFYLNENLEPTLTNYESELNISYDSNNQEIVIIDSSGVKYHFGGVDATEQSNIHQGGVSSSTYTTSFYLHTIETIYGDIISFDYDNIGMYSLFFTKIETQRKILEGYGDGENLCPPPLPNSTTNSQITQRVFNGRRLSHIYNNRTSEEIHFNYTSQVPGNYLDKRLENIEISNNTTLQKKIRFEYLTENNGSRFFLENVKFYDKNDSNPYSYEFLYNDPLGLPQRGSNSQDLAGYYNGKNNITLLPAVSSYFTGNNYADRSPDFDFSSKGTLTKITYPTGGFTEFEYESPVKFETPVVPKHLRVYINKNNYIPEDHLLDNLSFASIDQNGAITNEIVENQGVDVVLNVEAENLFTLHHCFIKLSLYDGGQIVDSQLFQLFTSQDPITNPITYHAFNKTFNLTANHPYKIEVELFPNTSDPNAIIPNSIKITVDASFSILGYNEIPVEQVGIRVKSVKDYPSDGAEPIIKHYYYKGLTELNENSDQPSSGLVGHGEFVHFFGAEIVCEVDYGFYSSLYQYVTLNSEQFSHISNINNLFYPKVITSYGDDNFKNGGVEKTFLYRQAIHQQPYSNFSLFGVHNEQVDVSYDNTDMYNGKLLKEVFIKKEGNGLFINKERKFNYTLDESDYLSSLMISKTFRAFEYNGLTFYDFINLGFVKTHSTKINLTNVTEKIFYDLVDISEVYNLDAYEGITSVKNYEYDSSFPGQPTKITTTTSDSDEVLETRNYYVDQRGSLTNLNGADLPHYETLENQNRVSSPIQTESYINKNDVLTKLSTQRTLYSDESGKTLPSIIQSSKSYDELEDRVEFLKYDANGNLSEVKLKDGSITKYTYNGLNQVITKVENHEESNLNQNPNTAGTDCEYLSSLYQTSLVTSYYYDSLTHQISHITDPRCNTIYYEYDEMHRLKYVKDKNGNILSKNEYNYQTQN